jgi:nitrous oxide reductase accessory protein NosL
MKENLMKKVLVLMLFVLASACDNSSHKVPPRPTPVVTDVDYCKAAGENLQQKGCINDASSFTRKGKSFELFCQETAAAGVHLNPKCLTNINPKNLKECEIMMDDCTGSR